MRSTRYVTLILTLAATACAGDPMASAPTATAIEAQPAPLIEAQAGTEVVPGRYIVVLRSGRGAASASARDVVSASGGRVHASFDAALRGFAATLSADEVTRLRHDPAVLYVEQDAVIRAAGKQEDAPWGLDRIDQRDLGLNGTYGWSPTGVGVRAYVIDSGIRTSHEDFGGRASSGFDAVDGGDADDCNGHGTHVAATLGGATYGVAKAVTLVAVRVLDCWGTGTTSSVIAGVDWVTANHVAPAVANLSVSGAASTALDAAIGNAIAAGVTVVVAAGNEARDACGYSPARVSAAITVGATTEADARWALSNTGACLDLFAPGADVLSAAHTGDAAALTMSGTSMATPHVAGTAALYLQQNPAATPATVTSALLSSATRDRLTGTGAGSPNLLAYTAPSEWWGRWDAR